MGVNIMALAVLQHLNLPMGLEAHFRELKLDRNFTHCLTSTRGTVRRAVGLFYGAAV